MKMTIQGVFIAVVTLYGVLAQAAEYPIGKPAHRYGMEIAAVYLQPVRMEPKGMMGPADKTDLHMETDIRALADNVNGFAEGDWIPYLRVDYAISKQGSSKVIKGTFMPMVANDGPHYGDNVKLDGPGRYHVNFTIYPPNDPANDIGHHFGRHTGRLTGVKPWFPKFDVDYTFVFAGIGKKGGY